MIFHFSMLIALDDADDQKALDMPTMELCRLSPDESCHECFQADLDAQGSLLAACV